MRKREESLQTMQVAHYYLGTFENDRASKIAGHSVASKHAITQKELHHLKQ